MENQSFVSKFVFSTDHKIISKQFLITGGIWAIIGGLLSVVMRVQLGFPHSTFGFLQHLNGHWFSGGKLFNPGSVDNVRLTKITRDSVQVAFGSTIKKIFVRYGKAEKTGDEVHMTLDTLGSKAGLELKRVEAIRIEGKSIDYKTPSPPPPVND